MNHSPNILTAVLTTDNGSEDDDDSDTEETGIVSINGHQWAQRRDLKFQVIWTDGDVTWEHLSTVNDCAAMDEYLTHHDVDDPLRLSKRKFFIQPGLTLTLASNE